MLSLSHFDLSLNKLEGKIPDSLGNLISISFLDFSDNQLQGEVPTFKNLSSLRFLDFSGNKFSGQASNVMNSLWNSSILEILDFSENLFYGSLPRIPRFRFLKELRLQSNEFNGSFVEGNLRLPSLEVLDVSGNRFSGSVPNLSLCYSLRVLNLTDNMFSGTLTQSIGYLSKLEYLGLGSNHLEGIISELNLFNLSNLQKLDLSFNTNLTIRVASNWNPPFRLDTIRLAYCELGPRFPEWLRNQTLVQDLDISNAKIYDTIPHWFWDNSESLLTVNMSSNKIYGVLPDLASKLVSLTSVDLSSNELNGSLPLFPPNVAIDLSNNSFSGTIDYFCNSTLVWDFLDLSKNQLSGDISEYCFERLMSARYLNLADNNLSGMVPNATNFYCALFSLHLRNNSFRGEIPMSLRDCGFMHVLDFSENNFTGKIPAWIGEKMKDLGVLSLRANKFYGSLPLSLCRLSKVQVLDFSTNKITGTIPKCVNNFTILSSKLGSNTWDDNRYIVYSDDTPIYDSAYVMWKGKQAEYVHSLTLLKAIDFSNNNLAGEIPFEITSLEGLMFMNLSRNDFVGSIPRDIGRLGLLNVLDLSHNTISGDIPLALTQLSHLGILDLSFNNLSGKIPWRNHLQTFSDSAFMGNPGLCGSPLVFKPCPEDEMRKRPDSNGNVTDDLEHEDMFITRWFYISMALGFIVSFWAAFGTLLLKKSKKLVTIEDWLYKDFGE
ncbi:hypothetical protein RD792_004020 [Penstemon davidsonii]|uniref:Uncharacterized protein n=1 Tax=Penstemon davidsonii TaxID=160366 RepID=A0ABR0DHN8_9LAMI|nr:hypothetical protein RD792_004020 [Penstemon davidsonii]